MALFGKKIKTWEDLLVFKHIPKKIENEEVVHQAFCLPTKELASITLKEIKRLIKKGQNPNWKDRYGKPLLAHLMEAQP